MCLFVFALNHLEVTQRWMMKRGATSASRGFHGGVQASCEQWTDARRSIVAIPAARGFKGCPQRHRQRTPLISPHRWRDKPRYKRWPCLLSWLDRETKIASTLMGYPFFVSGRSPASSSSARDHPRDRNRTGSPVTAVHRGTFHNWRQSAVFLCENFLSPPHASS